MSSSPSVTSEHVEELPETDVEAHDDGWQEASEVGSEVARAAWTVAAREILLTTAGTYREVVTYKDLAAEIQEATRIRTRQMTHHWVGDVLGRVAQECADRDEPNLASLCVNAQGSVGDAYAVAVLAVTGEAPEDPDVHASQQRLECYRVHGAEGLPDDGGRAALTPKLAGARDRVKKAEILARPILTCSRCFMALPPAGTCNVCD